MAEGVGAAERGQFGAGQVGAALRGVLPHVAEDVGHLQGEAQGVGVVGGALGAGGTRHGAEDPEGEPADRARDAAAVLLEVLPGLVRPAADVHQDAVDQLVEPAERDREAARGVGQGHGDRVGGVVGHLPVTDVAEQFAGLLQPGSLDLRLQRAVADVVDAP